MKKRMRGLASGAVAVCMMLQFLAFDATGTAVRREAADADAGLWSAAEQEARPAGDPENNEDFPLRELDSGRAEAGPEEDDSSAVLWEQEAEGRAGGILYVDGDAGEEDGDGSQQNPYADIRDAIDAAEEGDIIRVAAGTYDVGKADGSENLCIEKSVTIEALDPERRPVLTTGHPGNQAVRTQSTVSVLASNVTLRDLEIRVTDTNPNKAVEIRTPSDGETVTGTRIERCVLDGGKASSLYIGSPGVGTYEILDSTLHGSLAIANGAGNAMEDGQQAVIDGNVINGFVLVTGRRNTGWDLHPIEHLPVMTGNTIHGADYAENGVTHRMIVLYSDLDWQRLPDEEDIDRFVAGNAPDSGWIRIAFTNGDPDGGVNSHPYYTNCVGVVRDPVGVTDADGNMRTFGYPQDALGYAAQTGADVKLLQDLTLTETLTVEETVTVDLNGFDITGDGVGAIEVHSGALTLTGEGTVTAGGLTPLDGGSVIRVGSHTGEEREASLILGASATVLAPDGYGVLAFGAQTRETVTVFGRIEAGGSGVALAGNGADLETGTAFFIKPGAVLLSEGSYAVYHPQNGTVSVEGGVITGQGGIQMCAGTLHISGPAEISAQYAGEEKISVSGGVILDGAAVSLIHHQDSLAATPSARIAGGKLTASGSNGAVQSYRWSSDGAAAAWPNQPRHLTITGGRYSTGGDPDIMRSYLQDGYRMETSGAYWVVSTAGENRPGSV